MLVTLLQKLLSKKLLLLLILSIAGSYLLFKQPSLPPQQPAPPSERSSNDTPGTETQDYTDSEKLLQFAFANQQSDLQVEGRGRVVRILEDDNQGSRHQRFIIELGTGQTLLVAHNIDLAPRIDNLTTGDTLTFYGEYEWNAKGGVIHWTHHDPRGGHPDGWLKHRGVVYQ